MKKNLNATNIDSIEWNNDVLGVYFRNGAIVLYKGVPEGIYAGMAKAPSPGSYMNRYVHKVFEYEVVNAAPVAEINKALEHHKDTTVGLWATDKPELIPGNVSEMFFQIEYDDALTPNTK